MFFRSGGALRALLLAGLMAGPLLGAYGQPKAPTLRFKALGLDDGLSQSIINDVIQDREGFMWLGTQDGLNRFDGYRVSVLRSIPFDSTSLRDTWIHALAEAPDGALWVGTRSGLERRDPHTGRFLRDPRNPGLPTMGEVVALHVDPDGTVWVGMVDQGLMRLDPRTGRLQRYRHDARDARTISSDAITRIARAKDGALWVGTGNGLNRLAAGGDGFTRFLYQPGVQNEGDANRTRTTGYFDETYAAELQASFVTGLCPGAGAPGVLWASTTGGLVRLDLRTGAVQRVPLAPTGVAATVNDLHLDPHTRGVAWAATTRGLYRVDLTTGQAVRHVHDPNNVASLTDNSTRRLYADRTGLLWVTNIGVDRFDPDGVAFEHLIPETSTARQTRRANIYGMAEDRNGHVWMGSEEMLVRYEPTTGRLSSFYAAPSDAQKLGPGINVALYVDSTGVLWTSQENDRVDLVDLATGKVTRLFTSTSGRASGPGLIYSFVEDRARRLWAAAREGLYRVDLAARTFTPVALGSPIEGGSSAAYRLFEDAAGVHWVAMRNAGLRRLDAATGQVQAYLHDPRDTLSIASNSIITLHERAREPGVLWMGHAGAGLDRFDTRTGRTTHFTEASGMPSSFVYGILEDARGHLWLSTNNGVTVFDPERRAFTNYGTDAGLQSREFNINAFLRSRSGEMYFGGINGLNRFDPVRLHRNAVAPQVVLTGLRRAGRLVPVTEDGVLTAPLSQTKTLRLGPSARAVTLEFAALHFQNPARNRTQYRLVGFDPAWQEAGGEGAATYTNLAPGHYRFEVRGANSDGVWSAPTHLALVVLPPWWRTWWAYALYGLLALGALLWLVRAVRHRARVRERERVRAERERARERELAQAKEIEAAYTQLKGTQAQLVQQEKLASLGALTAGIAHEIKNPLNFVNNFAALSRDLVNDLRNDLVADPARPVSEAVADNADLFDDLAANVTRIEEHGRRADSIVKNMLAHSRGTTGQRESVDMNALVDEYTSLAFHGVRAQRPDFTCTVERKLEARPSLVEAVPQDVSRVVLNVVGNAFYAVSKRREAEGADYEPTVRVSTRSGGGDVVTEVWDNGGGIPEAVRAKIFEPFFTTKPTGEGTGLGLSLSHDIVAAHGGTLAVESAGGATTFTITLPRTP